MRKPPALAATLATTFGKLSLESRELLAAQKLTVEAVREAGSEAARRGLCEAVLPIGCANLAGTKVARELQAALVGFTFDWIETIEKDGTKSWALRLTWPLAQAGPAGAPV